MYSIAYVVPYFGKFPKGFQFWLLSCKCNPSIDWLIFTDDKTPYDYPENVKVTYWTFDTDNLQAMMNTVGEAGDVMHLSQNVVEAFIDRIEVFNDERVKIHFTFEDVLADHAE